MQYWVLGPLNFYHIFYNLSNRPRNPKDPYSKLTKIINCKLSKDKLEAFILKAQIVYHILNIIEFIHFFVIFLIIPTSYTIHPFLIIKILKYSFLYLLQTAN